MRNVIVISEWLEKRNEERRVVALIRECNQTLLDADHENVRRVLEWKAAELKTKHSALLVQAAPILRELLILTAANVLADRKVPTTQEAAFAVAVAAAAAAGDGDLTLQLKVHIAELTATLPDEFRRIESDYGINPLTHQAPAAAE